MWTRATYKAVADVLYSERMDPPLPDMAGVEGTVSRLTQRFAATFERDNPRFNRERFERAVYRDYEDGGE